MKPCTLSPVTMSPFTSPISADTASASSTPDRMLPGFPRIVSGRQQAGEADDVRHGEVERADQDDQGLPDRDESQHAHSGEDVADVPVAEEVAPDRGDQHCAERDDSYQGYVDDGGGVEAHPPLLGVTVVLTV
jgi:hypothetical protein